MQARFLSCLGLTYIDGRRWCLSRDLAFRRADGTTVRAQRGFVTDFASIPRFFWRVLPPVGDGAGAEYGPAAVIHDALYQSNSLPRSECDAVFNEAMLALSVTTWRRWALYYAVRVFGGRAYATGPSRYERMTIGRHK